MRRLLLLASLSCACADPLPQPMVFTIPALHHRCDMNHLPLAAGADALAATGLNPSKVAPPTTWALDAAWREPDGLPDLDTSIQVVRSSAPTTLLALDVELPDGACATGRVLDAGYDATFTVGNLSGTGVVWTRSDPAFEIPFTEARWTMPLEQAPQALQTLAATHPDEERAFAEVILTVLDRQRGQDVTWVLQRTHGYSFASGNVETPRQWLLARGTWTVAE